MKGIDENPPLNLIRITTTRQRELWEAIGIPGIEGIVALGQQFSKGTGENDRNAEIKALMGGTIGGEIFDSSEEKSPCRGESSAMLRMVGLGVLKLEMDKTASQLNQSFIKRVVWCLAAILEPELLKHIMRFVIVLGIETLKVSEIARVKWRRLIQTEALNKKFNPFGFFHALILLPSALFKKAGWLAFLRR
jgi:hypothetical protein